MSKDCWQVESSLMHV